MRWIAFLLWLAPTCVQANDWDAFRLPGAIAIMRHALAPGTGDPGNFRLEDCTTQRNLNEAGRQQARKTGEALRERGIVFDKVFTSQWCRARETARLLDIGTPIDMASLNSFFGGQGDRSAQTDETRAALQNMTGTVLLVTHQVNISALTGLPARSGEIIIFQLENGAPQTLGSILIDP